MTSRRRRTATTFDLTAMAAGCWRWCPARARPVALPRARTGPASPSLESHPYCTTTTGFIPMAFLEIGQDGTLYYLHNAWNLQDDGEDGDNRGRTGNDIVRAIPNALAVDTSGEGDVVCSGYGASFPLPEEPLGLRRP